MITPSRTVLIEQWTKVGREGKGEVSLYIPLDAVF
jgi:hypothetical protein